MVHPIFLAEGYCEYLDKFVERFHGKNYANGKAKCRMREIRFFVPSINECGYEEFLSDIKSFTHFGKFDCKKACGYKNPKQTGHGLKNRMRFFTKLFRKFFPQIQDIEKDFEKVKDNKTRQEMGKKGDWFLMELYPVGKVLDAHRKDGVEQV